MASISRSNVVDLTTGRTGHLRATESLKCMLRQRLTLAAGQANTTWLHLVSVYMERLSGLDAGFLYIESLSQPQRAVRRPGHAVRRIDHRRPQRSVRATGCRRRQEGQGPLRRHGQRRGDGIVRGGAAVVPGRSRRAAGEIAGGDGAGVGAHKSHRPGHNQLSDGWGLNITVMSLTGKLNVGLISCPAWVPNLWRIADGFDVALEELLDCKALRRACRPLGTFGR